MEEQQRQENELKRLEIEARRKPGPPIIGLGGGAFYDLQRGEPVYPPSAEPKTPNLPAEIQGYNLAKEQGFQGTFFDYKRQLAQAGAMNAPVTMIPAIPPGKTEPEFVTPPTRAGGAPQPTGFKPDRPIDFKRAAADAAKEGAASSAVAKADQMMQTVDQALRQTSFFTTGIVGAGTGLVPGTPAYDLRRTVDTIKANIGFDELQAMRQASPTGGALGQVAVQELNMLQSTLASMDPNQSEPQLRRNLEKVRKHYANWKAAVDKGKQSQGGDAWDSDKERRYQEWLKTQGAK